MKYYKLNKKFQFLFPFLYIIGIVLIVLGLNDKKAIDLKYDQNNNIRYNVYLKENQFFETPYLPEGRTYIASLIDYLDVFFHYEVVYNRKLTGNYKYKFVALVRANKKDDAGYYWEKEFDLTDEKTIDIKNNVNVSIDDNVQVKYSTYNEILNNFKKEYGVNTDGELKIIMRISNTSKFEKIKEPVVIDTEMNITIPLLEQSLEIAINKDTSSNDNILSIKEKSGKPVYLIFKITGVILIIVSILGFIDVTKTNIVFKRKNRYEIKLDNILTSYDSVIANINALPDLSGFKKIEISTFEELLDVYNEVRMPINFCQDEDKSTFIIINDSIVWIYVLKKDTMKWVDSNEKNNEKENRK